VIQVNRDYPVQFNESIDPYNAYNGYNGLRFHSNVNSSVLKFLSFEQVKDYHCQKDYKTNEMKDHEMSQVFPLMKDEQMNEIRSNRMMLHNHCESQMSGSSNQCEQLSFLHF
jgi:hypothetical protein